MATFFELLKTAQPANVLIWSAVVISSDSANAPTWRGTLRNIDWAPINCAYLILLLFYI